MRLRKYHGLGNDFLILLDPEGSQAVDGAVARAVCERHRGAGADGLIRVTTGPGGPAMELYNADGGRAEISGNGLRCVARAVIDGGIETGPAFVVTTDAGPRAVEVLDGGDVQVEMGTALLGPPVRPPWDEVDVGWSTLVNVGNPHVVLEVADPAKADLAHVEGIQLMYPGGINVELVALTGEDELTMRVWERGVGETLACGSGACAAAVAAHRQGAVGSRVTVRQTGGDAVVEIDDGEDAARPVVTLTGPAQYVCDVEFPWP